MVAQDVAELIRHHVTLDVAGTDRMHLNVYVPGLPMEGGLVHFIVATAAHDAIARVDG